MNFFCVGFFLVSIQLNINMAVHYAVQLIGMLFILGGILEIKEFNVNFKLYLNTSKLMCLLLAASSLYFVLAGIFDMSKKALNISGLAIGIVMTLLSLLFQKRLICGISKCTDLVNDVSGLVRVKKTWTKLAVITLVGLAADIGNRVIPVEKAAAVSGTVLLFSRIVLYVAAFILLWRFNKIRTDFNLMQQNSIRQ